MRSIVFTIFGICQEAFFKDNQAVQQELKALVFSVNEWCIKGPYETADAHNKMAERIRSTVTDRMDEFNTNKPMFRVFHDYMKLIRMTFTFIKATRAGNWVIGLAALEGLVKYCFLLTN